MEPEQTLSSLKGQMLIAMPGMGDVRFTDSVIYLVGHGDDGAMGLIINQVLPDLNFPDILSEMGLAADDKLIELPASIQDRAVLRGGPVEKGRGFVLHSPDYEGSDTTISVDETVCLTATTDILKDIVFGHGPEQSLFVLGYCGWAAGQLEDEIMANGWLTAPQSTDLLFETPIDSRYEAALSSLGINRASLSSTAGSA